MNLAGTLASHSGPRSAQRKRGRKMEFQTGYYSRNYALPPTLFSLDSVAKRANLSSSSSSTCFPNGEGTFLSTVEKKRRTERTPQCQTSHSILRFGEIKDVEASCLQDTRRQGQVLQETKPLSALHLFFVCFHSFADVKESTSFFPLSRKGSVESFCWNFGFAHPLSFLSSSLSSPLSA